MTSKPTIDSKGAWAIVLGASVWGFFWYPLRLLDSMGFTGTLAITMVSLLGAIVAILVTFYKREGAYLRSAEAWLIGIPMGVSCVLYFLGIMTADVIRVVFLFYLLPFWTMLIARFLFGEAIKPIQIVFIVLALVGLWLLLGGGTQLPIPSSMGDWCGLCAGITWALSLCLLRGRPDMPPFASTAITLLCTGLLSAIIVVTVDHPVVTGSLPDSSAWPKGILFAFLFGGIILFPSMLGQIWGARLVPAPTAALLMMSEIIVATLSAFFLLGTELNTVSWLGGLLIVTVVCMDLIIKQRDLALNAS